MKFTSNRNRHITIFLFFLLMSLSPAYVIGQETHQEKFKDFRISIQNTAEGVKLRSTKGSAWLTLSFNLDIGETQAIDEYGMTRLGRLYDKKNSELADFLFTLTKTEEGILLKGIAGTAWTELCFPLRRNQKQCIDAYGMNTLN